MNEHIYLDYNASTPIDPIVAKAMMPFIFEHFGNPSCSHSYGSYVKVAIENARRQVAQMLCCNPDEIIFTSGGSESNNYAIKGIAYNNKENGNHIITSSIEHPSVLEVCKSLINDGFEISYLPVDKFGLIDPKELEKNIRTNTILISIMHANNEVGTIQPIEIISKIAKEHNILIHTDSAQSIGKIRVDVNELGVDLLTIAGHKFYAPKGIGALYIRSGTKLSKLIHGADHEMNHRAGTENTAGIVALGQASELISTNIDNYQIYLLNLRNQFEEKLISAYPEIKINGHPDKRLPNTSHISFKNLEANVILARLDDIAASAGAACHSENIDLSYVLEEMNIPLEYAKGSIRFSFGRTTTCEEIENSVSRIKQVLDHLSQSKYINIQSKDESNIKLTHYTNGLGCACKLQPQLLEEILKIFPVRNSEEIVVGTDTSDDAAVYKIDKNNSIIQTVDFFTPIVDDPFQFGEIAAANSLSDIYAMGGKPLFALNIVGFPSSSLPIEVLKKILDGAISKTREAGISIIGGHTIDDAELKFGLAVTGIIETKKVITNQDAQIGDCLVLTKPLGTGILSTALKKGIINKNSEISLYKNMVALNDKAAEIMQQIVVNACTDITGFGLLGHLLEMMNASETSAEIIFEEVPFLQNVLEYAMSGSLSGGTKSNFHYTEQYVSYNSNLSEIKKMMINDAQTSGGLLISVSKEKSELLVNKLTEQKLFGKVIGNVIPAKEKKIFID